MVMSFVRQVRCLPAVGRGSRTFHATRVAFEDVVATPAKAQRRPVGGFRGGIFGFLLGFSLASGIASYQLLDEYKKASATLQASVEELQGSTLKVAEQMAQIEAVEKEVRRVGVQGATREEVSKVRIEMKKLFDSIHIEMLGLRARLYPDDKGHNSR